MVEKSEKRRRHNTGTIYQRGGTGLFYGSVTVPGTRQRLHVQPDRDYKVVEERLIALQRQVDRGQAVPRARETVGSYLEWWLSDVVALKRAHNTWRAYSCVARKHILPALGRIQLEKLTPERCERLFAQMAREGRSPGLIVLTRAVLVACLGYAHRSRRIPYNPAYLTECQPIPRHQFRSLTPEDLPAFLAAIAGHRLEPLYALLVGTGLRIGEALGLAWTAVDLERRELTISRQLDKRDGQYVFTNPKREASLRMATLPRFVVERLRRHRRGQAEERIAARGNWRDTDLVFTDERGGPLSENVARRRLYALLEAAGIPRLTLQELRHSYATIQKDQGTDPKTLQEQLGHSSVATTLDLYPETLRAQKLAAADRMDALLRHVE